MTKTEFLDGRVTLHGGDCRDVLRDMPDASIDSIVTDPPYALVSIGKRFGAADAAPAREGATGAYARASRGFMGKQWDTGEAAFAVEFWAQVLRVLKPGGHVVAFSGTRTYHRLACAIEDAGFEIRDQLAWVYGAGFPKSHDVSKGIDKKRDDRADILRVTTFVADAADHNGTSRQQIDAHMGTSDMGGWWTSRLIHRCQCPKWDQWLTLKAFIGFGDGMDAEVWRLNGRKGSPGEAWANAEVVGVKEGAMSGWSMDGETKFVDREIKVANSDAARQWQGWGTALKPAWEPIVLARKPLNGTVAANVLAHGTGALNVDGCRVGTEGGTAKADPVKASVTVNAFGNGLNGGGCVAIAAGRWPANIVHDGSDEVVSAFPGSNSTPFRANDPGPALHGGGIVARSAGGFDDSGSAARFFYSAKADKTDRMGSGHPTVKPVDLMQWLCRLVTPPGGVVLDPFAGSGSTGEAAWREGFRAILCEREVEYQADIAARLSLANAGPIARRQRSIKQAEPGGLFANDNAPEPVEAPCDTIDVVAFADSFPRTRSTPEQIAERRAVRFGKRFNAQRSAVRAIGAHAVEGVDFISTRDGADWIWSPLESQNAA